MNKKPDALLVLAIVFALGIVVSALTHGGADSGDGAEHLAVSAVPQASQARQ